MRSKCGNLLVFSYFRFNPRLKMVKFTVSSMNPKTQLCTVVLVTLFAVFS